jgi:tetratricopeptide (TPR) repeat protein
LFAVAWLWRVAYLVRLAATPLGSSLTEDARTYWEWSTYLRAHGPLGHNAFFLGPLYPYVLAVLRTIGVTSIPFVLHVQALWGAAATALLADAARRLTKPSIALGVGAWVALHPMAVFFDGLVLMESLLFCLEALLLWQIAREEWRAPSWRSLAVVGLLIGLLAEGRATSALLLAPAALFLVPWRGVSWRAAARGMAALALGFLVVVTPFALRNARVSGEWIPFTYNLGFNLRVGNNPEAWGGFSSIMGTQKISALTPESADGGAAVDGREYLRKTEGLDLSPRQSSAHWSRLAREWIAQHPGRAVQLSLRKLAMMWSRREYPQIENADEYRALAGPLGWPWIASFAVLGTLAIAGLGAAWALGRRGLFLIGYVVVMTLGIVPFFVTDRYRHHLVPAAVLLAALAAARAAVAARRESRIPGAQRALALGLVAGLVIVNLPTPSMSQGKYAWSLAADLGSRWLERGRADLAAQEFERAISLQHGTARAPGAAAASERGDLYTNYATALARLGRTDEALVWHERATQETPDQAYAVRGLADAYRDAGRTTQADSLYARLAHLVGGEGLSLEGRGIVAARESRMADAEALFAQAVAQDPSLTSAWGALLRVQAQSGDLEAARATLERARAAGLSANEKRAYEALLAALQGDRAAAERALGQVPASAIAADPTLADVIRVTNAILAGAR